MNFVAPFLAFPEIVTNPNGAARGGGHLVPYAVKM
jgi:hypothetical protein